MPNNLFVQKIFRIADVDEQYRLDFLEDRERGDVAKATASPEQAKQQVEHVSADDRSGQITMRPRR